VYDRVYNAIVIPQSRFYLDKCWHGRFSLLLAYDRPIGNPLNTFTRLSGLSHHQQLTKSLVEPFDLCLNISPRDSDESDAHRMLCKPAFLGELLDSRMRAIDLL